MSGVVYVNGQRADKPGAQVAPDAKIEVRGNTLPMSAAAVLIGKSAQSVSNRSHRPDVYRLRCLDRRIYGCAAAKRCGKGLRRRCRLRTARLEAPLRRARCVHGTHERALSRPRQIPDELDFASIDVSFISLKLILPAVHRVLKEGGHVACLIKPQFEAGREKVGKKGVVRDPDVHLEVLENFLTHAKDSGFTVLDITFSPIRGPEGNIEYLGYLESGDWVEKTFDLQGLVEQSHAALDHGKEGAGC